MYYLLAPTGKGRLTILSGEAPGRPPMYGDFTHKIINQYSLFSILVAIAGNSPA